MLREKINQDLKKAQQEKNELVILVLRGINAAIHNKEIEKRTKLSKQEKDIEKLEKESKIIEEEVMEVVSNEAKKRKEAIEEFKKGDRNDLAEKEQKELEILKKYLPEQIGEDQIRLAKTRLEKKPKKLLKKLTQLVPRILARLCLF
jgi:uncharacterized protein YqeY